jgi:hypothetical protein
MSGLARHFSGHEGGWRTLLLHGRDRGSMLGFGCGDVVRLKQYSQAQAGRYLGQSTKFFMTPWKVINAVIRSPLEEMRVIVSIHDSSAARNCPAGGA